MKKKPNPSTPKALREMFTKLLQNRVQQARKGTLPPDDGETVLPHGSLTGIAIDPANAWKESQFCLKASLGKATSSVPCVPGWAAFVQSLGSFSAMPMASGHFPHAMKNLWDLPEGLTGETCWNTGPSLPELEGWVNHPKQSVARILIATGICRLGGEHELAERYLYSIKGEIACEAFQNELGALEWAKGSHTSARNCWEKAAGLPMADFNLGLAWLADGNRNKAANHFQQALANIPSSSGWHHLGELYQQIN